MYSVGDEEEGRGGADVVTRTREPKVLHTMSGMDRPASRVQRTA